MPASSPGGTARTPDQTTGFVTADVDGAMTLLCDTQTSGGRLIACTPAAAARLVAELGAAGHDAAVMGEVVTGTPGTIELPCDGA